MRCLFEEIMINYFYKKTKQILKLMIRLPERTQKGGNDGEKTIYFNHDRQSKAGYD